MIKITVMRMARYDDLSARYENPLQHACDMHVGDTFYSSGGEKPEGMCDSAWESMEKFVKELARGGGFPQAIKFFEDGFSACLRKPPDGAFAMSGVEARSRHCLIFIVQYIQKFFRRF